MDRWKEKKHTTLLLIIVLVTSLCISSVSYSFFTGYFPATDITQSWYNGSSLQVTMYTLEPRILWYDFQYYQENEFGGGTWITCKNQQIDVDGSKQYRFKMGISSDQGWDDIEYIDMKAWFDSGSESNSYTDISGGNYKFWIRYDNSTESADVSLEYPTTGEITLGSWAEEIETDADAYSQYNDCYNLSFVFTPGYQFRYAPGDGSWDVTENVTNDLWSWNFQIVVTDGGEGASGPLGATKVDEFGVYAYTAIASAGSPVIRGEPGILQEAESAISVITRSNANYSLSVDVDDLVHGQNPAYTISNTTVYVKGGDRSSYTNITGSTPIFLYGSSSTYHSAETSGLSKTTSNVWYRCNIPIGQQYGDYEGTVYYHLQLET